MKIFIDLESTSKDVYQAEIIEGFFLTEDGDEFHMKCRPNKWSDDAEKIHKISKQTADRYDSFESELNRLLKWLPRKFAFICYANPTTVYGHIHYDYGLLLDQIHQLYFNSPKWWDFLKDYKIDVLSVHTLAKEAELNKILHVPLTIKPGNKRKSKDFSQENIARLMGYKYKAHDCVEDVLACRFIYNTIMEIKEKSKFWVSLEEK